MSKIRISDDKELVKEIDKQLNDNFKKYGKRYCPCSIQHTEKTVCMCKEFREMEEGTCHCGKFIKEK